MCVVCWLNYSGSSGSLQAEVSEEIVAFAGEPGSFSMPQVFFVCRCPTFRDMVAISMQ